MRKILTILFFSCSFLSCVSSHKSIYFASEVNPFVSYDYRFSEEDGIFYIEINSPLNSNFTSCSDDFGNNFEFIKEDNTNFDVYKMKMPEEVMLQYFSSNKKQLILYFKNEERIFNFKINITFLNKFYYSMNSKKQTKV